MSKIELSLSEEFVNSFIREILTKQAGLLLPPYDMPLLSSRIGKTLQIPDTDDLDPPELWTKQYFVLLNMYFFYFHSLHDGDQDRTVDEAIGGCRILFKTFVEGIEYNRRKRDLELPESEFQLQVVRWSSMTKSLVWKAYINNPQSRDSMGRRRNTVKLLTSMFDAINELELDYEEQSLESVFPDGKPVIPYNIWGNDYDKALLAVDHTLPLSSKEQPLVSIPHNIKEVTKQLQLRMNQVVDVTDEDSFKNEVYSFDADLQSLFKDYIRRIRLAELEDSFIIFAAEHWRNLTVAILERSYTHISGRYVVSLEKGDMSVISPGNKGEELYSHERSWRIVSISLDAVFSICSEYINLIRSHKLDPKWAAKLKGLEIDYKRLYSKMNNRFFTMVSFDTFKRSFEDADFKLILGNATRNSIGAIKTIIIQLGDEKNIGYDWLVHAAESVYEGVYGKAAVGKLKATHEPDCLAELKQMLEQACPGFVFVKRETRENPRKN